MTDPFLPYASAPSPAGAEVRWRGNEFEVTLPPRGDRRLRHAAVAGAMITVACWMTAIVAAGVARAAAVDGGVPPAFRWAFAAAGVAMAVVFGLVGALPVYTVLVAARQARMWTRVSLRDGMLIFEVPGLLGVRVIRHRLAAFDDARVRPSVRKNDERQFLVLRRSDGRYVALLNDLVYHTGDLQAVATAIRAAIVKCSGGL